MERSEAVNISFSASQGKKEIVFVTVFAYLFNLTYGWNLRMTYKEQYIRYYTITKDFIFYEQTSHSAKKKKEKKGEQTFSPKCQRVSRIKK